MEAESAIRAVRRVEAANDQDFTCEGFLAWLCKVIFTLAAFGVLGLSLLVAAGWRPW